jgi:hypothetical protein
MQVLVLHGPNLNLLGTREPAVDGTEILATIDADLAAMAAKAGSTLFSCQSNHEGTLIDREHGARSEGAEFIINRAALTHTSVALRMPWRGWCRPSSRSTCRISVGASRFVINRISRTWREASSAASALLGTLSRFRAV